MDNSMTEYKKKSRFTEMVDSLKLKAKIMFAGKNQDKIKATVLDMSAEKRLQVLDSQANKLDDLGDIIKDLPELDKMVALGRYINNGKIKDQDISEIVLGLGDVYKISVLERYLDKLDGQNVLAIVGTLNKENKLKGLSFAQERIIDFSEMKVVLGNFEGKEKIEGKTIGERVEEIMEIAEERAEPRDIAKTQMEIINVQEQAKENKKPTAMLSKDDSFVH